MSEEKKQYPPVYPNIEDWPIYKLSEDRRAFVKEIDDFMLQRFLKQSSSQLTDLIAKTVFFGTHPHQGRSLESGSSQRTPVLAADW